MIPVRDLFEPSNDAIDYNTADKRTSFLRFFTSTSHLERLRKRDCLYIVGDKGSGKTALALYFELSNPDSVSAKLLPISMTDYKKFISLKIKNRLEYTDYAGIWRTTLLMLMSQHILDRNRRWIHRITGKFRKVEAALKNYDMESLLPELDTAVEFARVLQLAVNLKPIPKSDSGISSSETESVKEASTTIRYHLLESEKLLKEGLKDVKLHNDFVLLLDGLDSKPEDVSSTEFSSCLQGLMDAAWQLNMDFFSHIKDTHGRMRVVILIRPDIFDSLNIPNSNSRINDNAVVLRWETTESDYKSSNLYRMVDKYFYSQNADNLACGWQAYFPDVYPGTAKSVVFTELLKGTFVRPRDFFTAIKVLIRKYRDDSRTDECVRLGDFHSTHFSRELSDYLLGEVKNYANYLMSNKDFSEYLTIFQYLYGKQNFSYAEYLTAFGRFKEHAKSRPLVNRSFLEDPESLLQFMYDVNLVASVETPADGSSPFIHWAYRERTTSNLSPKVKIGASYMVFPGIMKAVDIGKRFLKQ